jgi:hypothetical protein
MSWTRSAKTRSSRRFAPPWRPGSTPTGFPRPPAATAEAVRAVEEATGCPLPPLLRRLFLEVANGGFGPGHGGILGVPGYQGGCDWEDLLPVHRAFGSEPDSEVPRHMLWLCSWGCCTWSLVDCSSPEGVMWVWEPHSDGGRCTKSLFCQGIFLSEWLAAWLEGRLRQPEITQDVMPNIPGQLTLFNDPGTGARDPRQLVPDSNAAHTVTRVTPASIAGNSLAAGGFRGKSRPLMVTVMVKRIRDTPRR